MPDVLVVLTNWNSPQAVPLQVEAFRRQTMPVEIVVVDNSPRKSPQELDADRLEGVADVWRFRRNAGPPCRWAPALMLHGSEYVLFYDDDLLPGDCAIEHLLETAKRMRGKFAVLGEIGRFFDREGRYVRRNVRRDARAATPVDMTCRSHFVHAANLHHILRYRWLFHAECGQQWHEAVDVHDDIFLCLGLQLGTGLGCYLTPKPADNSGLLRRLDIREKTPGISARPQHLNERSAIGAWFIGQGWTGLARRGTDIVVPMMEEGERERETEEVV